VNASKIRTTLASTDSPFRVLTSPSSDSFQAGQEGAPLPLAR
jgi:hypothetical protein